MGEEEYRVSLYRRGKGRGRKNGIGVSVSVTGN